MNPSNPTPSQIRARLLAAVIAVAAGATAIVITVLELKGILG
jgi:hypothetical protein